MKFILSISTILATLTACTPHSSTGAVSDHFLSRASSNVARVAAGEGIAVDRDATVSAARADGGSAVFVPEADPAGGFVGWLDLPQSHACANSLPAANYAVTVDIGAQSARVSWRQIEGTAKLDAVTIPVLRIDSVAPATPMARIALGPDSFLLGRWFACSDGAGGHCGYALTLDASTPGCGN